MVKDLADSDAIPYIIATLPGAILGTLGWFGRFLMEKNPKAYTLANIVGGLMVSAFTGICAGLLLLYWEQHIILVLAVSSVAAANGEKGFRWISDILNRSPSNRSDSNGS